jgi:hypothetical protein
MKRIRAPRTGAILQELLFHLLLLAAALLLAWLSVRQVAHWDWTDEQSNGLTAETQALLQHLEQPLRLTSFAPDEARLRRAIGHLLERFSRAAPDRVRIEFVDPQRHPQRARAAGIEKAGELLLDYAGRQERLQTLSEGHIQLALQRLLGRSERWIGALSGHGERTLLGHANHDLGDFGRALENRGYRLQTLDLAHTAQLPENLGLLLIAGPQTVLPATEVQRLRAYVKRGGHLLWLLDSDGLFGLDGLAHDLGLTLLPGKVVDANVREFGVDDPTVALVSRYPQHPATQGFDLISLFPRTAALEMAPNTDWQATALLRTQPRSWNETGPVQGQVRRDPAQGERAGPLTIGFALERSLASAEGAPRQQRVVLVGDGDFLANAFVASAGNQALGLRLIHWLMQQQSPATPAPVAAGKASAPLRITRAMAWTLGLGALLLAPLSLLLTGWLIHRRRQRA